MNNSFVFYKSFYDAMQFLDHDERCEVLDMICNLAFNNAEPNLEFASSDKIKIVYAISSEQIKASIKHRNDGSKGGRPRKEEIEKGVLTPLLTPVKTNVNVNVNENINGNGKVNVNKDNLLTTSNIIKEFAKDNGFKLGQKTIDELSASLFMTTNPRWNLDTQLNFIKDKYPTKTGDELAKLFVASLHWDDIKQKELHEPKKEPVEEADDGRPKKCPICHKKLIKNGLNTIICGHCREEGHLVWWEKENNEWIRQDTTSA